MDIQLLKSKLHRVAVTGINLNCAGSLALMKNWADTPACPF